MRRREFIGIVGGLAALGPRAARAQETERVRRVGVLMATNSGEREAEARLAAFTQGLQEAGWTVGRNVRIDIRWSVDAPRLRKNAADLVALNPDVILAGVGGTTSALQEASRTVPIVFAQVIDPVGAGNVATLARPGGNATGFTQFEYSLSGKWLELLKELVPQIKRVGVLRDPSTGAGIGQWAVIQAVAQPTSLELSTINLGSAGEIERAIAAFVRQPNGGLIVAVSAASQRYRELIVTLAARYRVPVVYPYRFFVSTGGLISYGPELVNQYRRAAGYVDRILKGEKPADLPVQAPTRYQLAINHNTAKSLGLTIPPTLLARADEVIE